MHPEYLQNAPGGAGWYVLAEDGRPLERGPFPSEEAAWAEIARLEPRDERRNGPAPSRQAGRGQVRPS